MIAEDLARWGWLGVTVRICSYYVLHEKGREELQNFMLLYFKIWYEKNEE